MRSEGATSDPLDVEGAKFAERGPRLDLAGEAASALAGDSDFADETEWVGLAHPNSADLAFQHVGGAGDNTGGVAAADSSSPLAVGVAADSWAVGVAAERSVGVAAAFHTALAPALEIG